MNSIIQTPTPDIEASLDFYKKLSFKVLSEKEPTLLTDGKVVIDINPDRFARAGVKLYKASWKDELAVLEQLEAIMPIENGYLLTDAGTHIYLLEKESGIDFKPEEVSFSTLGNVAGLSLETSNIGRSAKIWETVGFSKTMGDLSQGWISFENEDGLGVSLMKPMSCPHLFFNPSLTYFNGKENNPKIIQKIRDLNIPITEEITAFNKEGIVDNVIIRDPGGFGFFIFND